MLNSKIGLKLTFGVVLTLLSVISILMLAAAMAIAGYALYADGAW